MGISWKGGSQKRFKMDYLWIWRSPPVWEMLFFFLENILWKLKYRFYIDIISKKPQYTANYHIAFGCFGFSVQATLEEKRRVRHKLLPVWPMPGQAELRYHRWPTRSWYKWGRCMYMSNYMCIFTIVYTFQHLDMENACMLINKGKQVHI